MPLLPLLLLLSCATSQLPPGAPWPMFGGSPQHARASLFPGPHLPPAVITAFPVTYGGAAEPAVAPDGSIVACSSDASVRRFDAGGRELWRYGSGPSWCLGSPLLVRGLVVVAFVYRVLDAFGPTPLLVALDFSSGAVVWENDPPGGTGATCWSSPALTPEGVLLVACCDGDGESNIAGLNSDTGAQLWTTQSSSCIKSSPSLSQGQVTFFSESGDAFALTAATGAQLFAASFPNHTFFSSPTVSEDGELYIGYSLAGGGGGGLLALDGALRQRWDLPLPSTVRSSPALSSATGLLYINADCAAAGCTKPALYAVDVLGTVQWAAHTGGGFASPVLDGMLVYGGSDNGTVFALDQATGSVVWSIVLRGGAQSPVIAAPGRLLLQVLSPIVPAEVQITSAWWGLNCAKVNLTLANVTATAAAVCSGRPDSCFLTTAGLPDPALYCYKDVRVNFTCGGSDRYAYLPPNNAATSSWYLFITCREPSGLVLLGEAAPPAGSASPSPSSSASPSPSPAAPPAPPPAAAAAEARAALGLSAASLAGVLAGAGAWLWGGGRRARCLGAGRGGASSGSAAAAALLGGSGSEGAEFRGAVN